MITRQQFSVLSNYEQSIADLLECLLDFPVSEDKSSLHDALVNAANQLNYYRNKEFGGDHCPNFAITTMHTVIDKDARNKAIYLDVAKDMSLKDIAKKYALSQDTVLRAVKAVGTQLNAGFVCNYDLSMINTLRAAVKYGDVDIEMLEKVLAVNNN